MKEMRFYYCYRLSKKIGLFALICALLFSCVKYEEGPEFSFRSKLNRLTGKWKLSQGWEIKIKNGDTLSNYYYDGNFCYIGEYKEPVSIYYTFNKDSTVIFEANVGTDINSFTIPWTFAKSENNELIIIMNEDLPFVVTRLTNSELFLEFDNDYNYEDSLLMQHNSENFIRYELTKVE